MTDNKRSFLPEVKIDVQISTKDLAPVAQDLIAKISRATGTFYQPWKIVREAKAIRKAGEELAGLSELGLTEIEMRAFQRVISEGSKQQENIERITLEATDALEDNAKPDAVDDDWVADFFAKARHISDEEFSTLWSKILAGEANRPGSFSKRTLNIIYGLTKEDAELFRELCRYVIMIGIPCPFIFHLDEERYSLNFENLGHLQDLGLVNFNSVAGFVRQGFPDDFLFNYGSVSMRAVKKPDSTANKNDILMGHVMFTKSGLELFGLADALMVPEFEQYVVKKISEGPYNASIVT
ncbi:MAG: DUF2806 domain-containing protein [Pseudomonadota bacterium]